MADWLAFVQRSLVVDLSSLIGVRELIIALVVLIVIYMLVVVLRMKSLSAQRRFDEIAAARYESDLSGHQATKKGRREEAEPSLSAPATATPRKGEVDALYGAAPRVEPKNKYFEPPEITVASFDQEKLTRLERELSSTREELDALRSAFAETRDSLKAEIERLKAGQRVSPVYGDSLQMAMSGASAEEIAARCGIARAEAELVLSLARGSAGDDSPESGRSDGLDRGNDNGKGGRSRYGSY